MGGLALAALVAVAGVPTRSGDCWLDQAQVAFVPPSTVQVLATYRCGAFICWERWIELDGQRRGSSRVCETDGMASDQLRLVPLPRP